MNTNRDNDKTAGASQNRAQTGEGDAPRVEHSPLPWEIGDFDHRYILTPVLNQYGNFNVCSIMRGNDDLTEQDKANAQFIVEACNNYERVCSERDSFEESCANYGHRLCVAEEQRDELLASAGDVLFIAKPWATLPGGTQGRNAYDKLRAAIAKASGASESGAEQGRRAERGYDLSLSAHAKR